MICKLFNRAQVLYQTADDDFDIAEPAIGVSIDDSGIIVLQQEGSSIVINRGTVNELCKVLRTMRDAEVSNG